MTSLHSSESAQGNTTRKNMQLPTHPSSESVSSFLANEDEFIKNESQGSDCLVIDTNFNIQKHAHKKFMKRKDEMEESSRKCKYLTRCGRIALEERNLLFKTFIPLSRMDSLSTK